MTRTKAGLARGLSSARILPLLSSLRTTCRADVPMLAYHRVCDVADEDRFPFDVELISASTSDFAWQMEYVRQRFNPITLGTLLEILDGKTPPPPKPLVITFDDGFDDNYHHVFPVVSSLQIPITIFLSTAYIDSTRTFWFDRLVHLVLRAPAQSFEVEGLGQVLTLSNSIRQRRAVGEVLLSYLKCVRDELRLSILRQLEQTLSSDATDASNAQSQPLTWKQVREMDRAGIEFGSHTVTHPILTNLTDQALTYELTESKRAIEYQLDKPVPIISYPVGGPADFDERVRRMAQTAGYRLGASYISGTNLTKQLDWFGLKRLHVERYTDRDYFAAMVSVPEIFQ